MLSDDDCLSGSRLPDSDEGSSKIVLKLAQQYILPSSPTHIDQQHQPISLSKILLLLARLALITIASTLAESFPRRTAASQVLFSPCIWLTIAGSVGNLKSKKMQGEPGPSEQSGGLSRKSSLRRVRSQARGTDTCAKLLRNQPFPS